MLDEVPIGWKLKPLGAIAMNGKEQWQPNPNDNFDYVGLEHIGQGDGVLVGVGSSADVISNKNRFRIGDILFGKLRPNLRKTVLSDREGICSTDILAVRANKDTDRSFLFHVLSSDPVVEHAVASATGTKMPRTNWKALAEFPVQLPPIAEQQRIAEILTSVDETIRATEAVIAQTERVKLGVMEDLLTGGLGSDAISNGEVPDGWSVFNLKEANVDVIDGDRGKSYPKSADFSADGHCLFLNAKNVTKSGFQFETTQFINEKKHNQLRKGHLQKGDIVVTTRGTLGNIAFYDESISYEVVRINSGMVILRGNSEQICTELLYQLMRSPVLQSQIAARSFGSAQPQLTVKIINALKLPIPPKSEQSHILDAILAVNKKLDVNKTLLSQTKRLKQGLMSDLLTGRKRVM